MDVMSVLSAVGVIIVAGLLALGQAKPAPVPVPVKSKRQPRRR